ncbi:hypothetical protein [Pasteurella sp. PK-2025]|uniref:hypothetical protein n=1 Tax=Pasteurella sp. PK-2025 TaxID=3413133 RepID=UPI003C795218
MGIGLMDPTSMFARYIGLSFRLHGVIFLLLCFLFLLPSCLSLWQVAQQLEHIQRQQVEQAQLLVQHQQRLHRLQQRFAEQALTPQLTQKIAQINAQLPTFSQGIQIQTSQWQFQSVPLLRLHLQSDFKDFQQFFTALLTQSDLEVLTLQLSQAEDMTQGSVLSEMLLFLPRQGGSQASAIKEKK